MKDAKILIVDDEEDILLTLKLLLKKQVARVITESNPYHIPRHLRMHDPDLVLLDMNYRRGDTSGDEGFKWLAKIKELQPETEVVIITAHGDIELAVKALKEGALDFVEKPWENDKLIKTLQAAMRVSLSEKKVTSMHEAQQGPSGDGSGKPPNFIANGKSMMEILSIIEKVSDTDANVLILGENGTGKEVAARQIHAKSTRRNKAFVKVDLGAIPDTLMESELFGHKQGAFTDARNDRIGRFQAADGGTLFLDEIGNLSLASQTKLLSALQNRVITPLGSAQPVPVDIRLICATNMPLHDMVAERQFRQDLLYRINTVELLVPPLRDRADDIPVLTNYFLDIFKKKYRKVQLEVSEELMSTLVRKKWPGNIRELRHTIERGVIMSDGSDLDLNATSRSQQVSHHEDSEESLNLENMERKLIIRALRINQGNVSKAAKELGLTRGALYRRIDKYDL